MTGGEASAVDAFPPYPVIEPLPAGMTVAEQYEFALQLIEQQCDRLGDYLFAAVRLAPDLATMERWSAMSSLVERLYGGPIVLSYRACDRIAAERREVLQ